MDAEKSVIGCLLLESALLDKARTRLSGKMFVSVELGLVFSGMLKLRKKGTPMDIVTVVAAMGDGYSQLLLECAEAAPHVSHFESYVDVVLEAWRVRTMQSFGTRLLYDGMTADEMTMAAAHLLKKQYEIVSAVREGTEKNFRDALYETYQRILQQDTAMRTGFKQFDAITGGLQRGGLYIFAARPGGGKTDFVLQMSIMLSKTCNVHFLSLEMSIEQLMQRVLSRVLIIPSDRFRDKKLTDKQLMQIDIVFKRMSDLHIVFDDAGGLSMEDILEKAERCKPDVIVLDYLGLVHGDRKKAQWEQTQELTGALKAMAKKHNLAVICLVQLNREVDKTGKDPTLSDLRGGGSVEADADAAFFILPEKLEPGQVLSGEEFRTCRMPVAKNRHGPQGELTFAWRPQYHEYTEFETRSFL